LEKLRNKRSDWHLLGVVEGIGKMEEEERGVSVMELKQRSAIVLWFFSFFN